MPHSSRLQQIADLHDTFNESLQHGVAQRVNTDEQTIEDACSYAWMQLLTHPNVSLTPEPPLLGWLTRTAVREAWRLDGHLRRTVGVTDDTIAALADTHGPLTPSSEDIALLRARIALVEQLPERPRRFLLRLMLGHAYDNIAAAENTTYRVVNRQVARAKRLLRQIEEREKAREEHWNRIRR